MREELRLIQAETGITAIIVTHDQEEALSLSHRMLVLDGGRVRQAGTPDEVYRQPADAFVADFVGSFNSIPVTLADGPDGVVARVGGQSLRVPASVVVPEGRRNGTRLLVRPEELTVGSVAAQASPPGALRGRIADVDFAGPVVALTVDVEDVPIRALALSPGVLADPSLVPGAEAWPAVAMDGAQLVAGD